MSCGQLRHAEESTARQEGMSTPAREKKNAGVRQRSRSCVASVYDSPVSLCPSVRACDKQKDDIVDRWVCGVQQGFNRNSLTWSVWAVDRNTSRSQLKELVGADCAVTAVSFSVTKFFEKGIIFPPALSHRWMDEAGCHVCDVTINCQTSFFQDECMCVFVGRWWISAASCRNNRVAVGDFTPLSPCLRGPMVRLPVNQVWQQQ